MTTVLLLLTRTESRRPHVVYVRIYASRVPLDFLYFLYSAQRLSSVLRRSRVSTSHRLSPHRREVVAPRSNALARSFFAEKRSSRRGRFLRHRSRSPPATRARARVAAAWMASMSRARRRTRGVFPRANSPTVRWRRAKRPRVVVRSLRVSSRPRENRFSRRRAPFGATIDDVTRLRTQLGEFAVDRRDRRFAILLCVCVFGFLRFARAYVNPRAN